MDERQQQTECAVCGNAAFDLLDGLYFCSDCGTQSQVLLEVAKSSAVHFGWVHVVRVVVFSMYN